MLIPIPFLILVLLILACSLFVKEEQVFVLKGVIYFLIIFLAIILLAGCSETECPVSTEEIYIVSVNVLGCVDGDIASCCESHGMEYLYLAPEGLACSGCPESLDTGLGLLY